MILEDIVLLVIWMIMLVGIVFVCSSGFIHKMHTFCRQAKAEGKRFPRYYQLVLLFFGLSVGCLFIRMHDAFAFLSMYFFFLSLIMVWYLVISLLSNLGKKIYSFMKQVFEGNQPAFLERLMKYKIFQLGGVYIGLKAFKSARAPGESMKLKIGFQREGKVPLFMIWREYQAKDNTRFGPILISVG